MQSLVLYTRQSCLLFSAAPDDHALLDFVACIPCYIGVFQSGSHFMADLGNHTEGPEDSLGSCGAVCSELKSFIWWTSLTQALLVVLRGRLFFHRLRSDAAGLGDFKLFFYRKGAAIGFFQFRGLLMSS